MPVCSTSPALYIHPCATYKYIATLIIGCFNYNQCILLLGWKWLLHSWLLYEQEREFSDTNFEIGKPCWSFDWMLHPLPWWRLKHSAKTTARFSDLKVGIRELSFLSTRLYSVLLVFIYYSPFGFTCCWWLDLNPLGLQFDSLQCVLAPWPGDQQCQLEEAKYSIMS